MLEDEDDGGDDGGDNAVDDGDDGGVAGLNSNEVDDNDSGGGIVRNDGSGVVVTLSLRLVLAATMMMAASLG